MKLSEVIDEIENGSQRKFVNAVFCLEKNTKYEGVAINVLVDVPDETIPLYGWKEKLESEGE